MCFRIYDYLQAECMRRPNELCPLIREHFAEHKSVFLSDSVEFVHSTQLCWNLSVNLRPVFYQIPNTYLRQCKYLFGQVLSIKLNLDLPDLLYVVDSLRKKYKEVAITSKEDFGILMSAYSLMIEQGYQIITNLYLPNMNCVLYPGRLLHFNGSRSPGNVYERPDDYVHPAVDRRICMIAGINMTRKAAAAAASVNGGAGLLATVENTVAPLSPSSSSSATGFNRLFPRVFGNKRLEGILARLDDEKIDINFINLMDEGNPQIVLDYLLEANRIHSLNAFLSEDDIFVVLKYFNDFLARNYQQGTFYRLKELKIFKPLWSEKYANLNFTVTSSTVNGGGASFSALAAGQSRAFDSSKTKLFYFRTSFVSNRKIIFPLFLSCVTRKFFFCGNIFDEALSSNSFILRL